MLKHIFLDLDDTILNFTAGEAKALTQALRESGIEPTRAVLDRYHLINIAHWELLEDTQSWEMLGDGSVTPEMPVKTEEPAQKVRKSVLPWAIPLGVSVLGLLLLGIFASIFPAEYAVASAVIPGPDVPADKIYTGLAGFLKCNNLEWLFRLCLVSLFGSLAAGLWQTAVLKRIEDAVDQKLDSLGEKNKDASM